MTLGTLATGNYPSAGMVKSSGSALQTAISGTDYAPPTSGSSILKGNGAGAFSNATAGTDYAAATNGTSGQALTSNGAGGFSTPVTLGTAAQANTGTSGANVPLLNGNNAYSGSMTASAVVNFAGATHTTPSKTGTNATLIATTCGVGETFFVSDAAAGSNWYGCTATNIWTLLGGGSGNVVGPNSSVAGDIPGFADTTGKVLADSYAVVTTVGSPGTNGNIPTEAAVRSAISAAGGGNVNAAGTLTSNLPVIGSGSTSVAVGSVSGNTTTFVTMASGDAKTSGAPLTWNSSGNAATPSAPVIATYGGTNNAFFQVSGPATSIKTYTFPNSNSTMAALGTAESFTAAQTFTSGNLLLGGATSGTTTLNATAIASGTLTLPAITATVVAAATSATAGQVLQATTTAGSPAWSTATYPLTTTANQILYSNATNTVTGLTTANNGVLVTSAGGVPSIGSTLPSAVQSNITALGTIASVGAPFGLSIGGTNANLTASTGGLVYSSASALAILAGTATANQIPMSGASAAPVWSTATYPATTTANQLLYSSALNAIAGLATANNGVLVTSAGGVPSISSTIPSATQDNITRLGTIANVGAPIGLTFGGSGASLTASNGGVVYSTSSTMAILGSTATARLPLVSGSSAAPTWGAIQQPASANSGGIPYYSSTTAETSTATLTAHGVILGEGSGSSPVATAVGSTGQVFAGSTGADPGWATVSAVLDNIGSTQGQVLYRGASSWSVLSPGTSGQFLETQGASANPQWQTVGGTISGLTTNAIVTAASSTTVQTPNGSATMDSSGNISTPGGVSSGVGSGDSGMLLLQGSSSGGQGWTVPNTAGTSQLYILPAPGGSAHFFTDNGSGTCPTLASGAPANCESVTWTASNGTGNVILSAGTLSITTGKTMSFPNTMTLQGGDSSVITFPNTTATALTTANLVTAAQGGSGVNAPTAHAVLVGEGTSPFTPIGPGVLDTVLQGGGASADPSYVSLVNCASDGAHGLTYSTSTHTWACTAITGSAPALNT